MRASRLRPLGDRAVALAPEGLLGGWQALNRAATIDHCLERLEATGTLDNLRRLRDPSVGEFRGMRLADSDPYELPPDRAYGETCAAIASLMWNWRLLLATGHGRYADEMERALYNAVAVSTSLDGCHFSYSNPLHVRDGHDGATEDAPSERLPWFACACCPPNVARLVASLHRYVATSDDDGIQLHHFNASRVESETAALTVTTGYPWDGRVQIGSRAGRTSGPCRCGSRPGVRPPQ